MITTWREQLGFTLEWVGETFEDIIANTLTDEEMDVPFDAGYGSEKGKPFTVWTEKRVYFPTKYDGSECVASVARHPDGNPTLHI